jgi:hypothetical protein
VRYRGRPPFPHLHLPRRRWPVIGRRVPVGVAENEVIGVELGGRIRTAQGIEGTRCSPERVLVLRAMIMQRCAVQCSPEE